jgi:hypothetical protein
MIRARVECIGSRAEIGVSYATVGLRAATDFRVLFGVRRRAKAEFQKSWDDWKALAKLEEVE